MFTFGVDNLIYTKKNRHHCRTLYFLYFPHNKTSLDFKGRHLELIGKSPHTFLLIKKKIDQI